MAGKNGKQTRTTKTQLYMIWPMSNPQIYYEKGKHKLKYGKQILKRTVVFVQH